MCNAPPAALFSGGKTSDAASTASSSRTAIMPALDNLIFISVNAIAILNVVELAMGSGRWWFDGEREGLNGWNEVVESARRLGLIQGVAFVNFVCLDPVRVCFPGISLEHIL